jgi:phospholipid transport system substrate-binding protein
MMRWQNAVLGRRGPDWTTVKREEFVGLFVQMLRDALANRIFEYSDERILYLSEQQEQGFAKVATKLWGHKVDTSVEFRLRTQAGQWLLYDAIIDRGEHSE